MNKKALTLISGGLDSILAALLVKNQGVKVTGLGFKSLFFNPEKRVKKICSQINIPFKVVDFSLEHLEMVKKPNHGYGKNANPCIDCHLLMIKKAKEIMDKEGFDFIVTGETLGQRPFSQNQNSLDLIEKKADLKGLILRPLSAKVLEVTLPEKKGWVDRSKLLAISGRSRKEQLALAKKFDLSGFSAPGTACILTDPQYGKRLLKLFNVNPSCGTNDIQLLQFGRHVWKDKSLVVVGRNHQENLELKKVAQKGDIILEPQSFSGPLILIRNYGKVDKEEVVGLAKKLLLKYSSKGPKRLLEKDFKVEYL